MKYFLQVLSFLLFHVYVMGQEYETQWTCGSENLREIDNPYGLFPERKMDWLNKKIAQEKRVFHRTPTSMELELPIVFHVIHQGSVNNIPDAQILDALRYLNESFSNTGSYDPSGNNAQIQFCLAKQMPDGTQFNGINRVESPLTNMTMESQDSDLKMLTSFPTSCYINVWVVSEINSISTGPGVAGYATFPGSHGFFNDGIVLEGAYTGTGYQENSVLTHEMGHYLALYHTFQDGCNNMDCTEDGDKVCDTPPDESTSYIPCTSTMNTCSTDTDSGFTTDQDDLFMNFMDYSDLPCYYLFTPGQIDRMHSAIQEARTSLLSCTSCLEPCPSPVTAEFTLSTTNGQVGVDINSTNLSSNAASYEWLIDGTFYSSNTNPTFNFNDDGTYVIRLIATGSDPNCVDVYDVVVTVSCNIDIAIEPALSECYKADSLLVFSFNDPDATDIEWFIDNVSVSTNFTWSMSFSGGAYKLSVVVSNDECQRELNYILLIGCNEICDNGYDDDNDGLIDCYDPECCSTCDDFYFEACSIGNDCPIEYDDFGIETKWVFDDLSYQVFNIVGGDVDQDGFSEVLTFNFSENGDLSFIDHEGNLKKTLQESKEVVGNHGPVIFDVDHDGESEVYFLDFDNKIRCVGLDGVLKWISDEPFTNFFTTLATFLYAADINYDGVAEIIVGNDVFNGLTGELLVLGDDNVYSRGEFNASAIEEGHIVVINILDDTTHPGLEIVTGNQILSVDLLSGTLNVEVQLPNHTDGAVAVVDWDGDNDLDVVSVLSSGGFGQADRIVVWEGQDGTILDQVSGGNRYSSVPTICNLDDDPELEMVVNTLTQTFQVDLIAYDHDMSIMWSHQVNELSNCPSIGFDFNGDGKNHLILRSFDFLEVIHGENGDILFKSECGSITNNEHPIILDIDNDGHAEIVTICNGRVTAFEGSPQEWAPTRNMWHQYYYTNTMINDDMTIPTVMQEIQLPEPNQGLNTSMTGYAALKEEDSFDFSLYDLTYTCEGDEIKIGFEVIYLRGGTGQNIALPVSIYTGETTSSSTTLYSTDIFLITEEKGDTISFTKTIPVTDLDLFTTNQLCLSINDPGTQLPFNFVNDIIPSDDIYECEYGDNLLCVDILGLDPDLLDQEAFLCELDSLQLEVPGTYESYLWNDGSVDTFLTVYTTGEYWVEVELACGIVVRDTIIINDNPNNIVLDLGPDQSTCSGGVFTFEAQDGFKSYTWPDGTDTRKYTAWFAGKYWVEVEDFCGTIQVDTIELLVEEITIDLIDTVYLCADAMYNVEELSLEQLIVVDEIVPNCPTCNSVFIHYDDAPFAEIIGIDANGCSARDTVIIVQIDDPILYDTLQLCTGIIDYHGEIISTQGDFEVILPTSNCDSIFRLHVTEPEKPILQSELFIECDPFSTRLEFEAIGENQYLYEWQDGSTDPIILNINAGTWTVTVFDNLGCEFDTSIIVPNISNFQYSMEDTIDAEYNQPVIVEVFGDSVGANITWIDPMAECDSCFTNTFVFEDDYYIYISVIDANGCETELNSFVRVYKDRDFYFGNIFSPNSDGVNDRFYLQDGDNIASYDLQIYDRWGSKVFDGINLPPNEASVGWDGFHNGKSVKQGVYPYKIKVVYLNGFVVEDYGNVTILR